MSREASMLAVTAENLPHRGADIPTYPGKMILGALREMQRNQIEFFSRLSRLGDLVRVRFGFSWYLLVSHRRYIRQVLIDKVRNCPKGGWGYGHLKPIIGVGLWRS